MKLQISRNCKLPLLILAYMCDPDFGLHFLYPRGGATVVSPWWWSLSFPAAAAVVAAANISGSPIVVKKGRGKKYWEQRQLDALGLFFIYIHLRFAPSETKKVVCFIVSRARSLFFLSNFSIARRWRTCIKNSCSSRSTWSLFGQCSASCYQLPRTSFNFSRLVLNL